MYREAQIITTISEHARSTVYLANDASGELCILKVLRDDSAFPLIKGIQSIGSPYFPKILDIQTDDGVIYVLEEYIEGETLDQILEDRRLSGAEALSFMHQLIEAVGILHRMEPPVIHRDIKPDNILITNSGELRLIDFDSARQYRDEEKTSDTVQLGTRGFAAPEQFGYSQTDIRSDLYSTGIVCSLIYEHSFLTDKNNKALKAFLDKATMFDPDRRFQSVGEMLTALKAAESPLSKVPRRFLTGGVLAVMLILCAAGLFVFRMSKSHDVYNMDIFSTVPNTKGVFLKLRRSEISEKNDRADMVYPGLVIDETLPVASSEDTLPVLRYTRQYPQAILFNDYRFESVSVVRISLLRLSDDSEVIDRLKLGDDDFTRNNNILCINVETLEKLQNGIYKLTIDSNARNVWEFKLIISDKPANTDALDLTALAPVQYYSISLGNEAFFNIYNTPFTLKNIYMNNELLDSTCYLMTKDGHGVILGKAALDKLSAYEKAELVFEAKDGRRAKGRIFVIP